MIFIPKTSQQDDLRTRIALCESLIDSLAASAKRSEQDSHDRSLKDQDQFLTLARLVTALDNLSNDVRANKDFLERIITKNEEETKQEITKNRDRIEDTCKLLDKQINFTNNSRWGFGVLFTVISAIGLDVISESIKHLIK